MYADAGDWRLARPTQEGPGILLLDDINRADDRILRGLMQLLQNFELFSWTLPPKWQIVATANPEGGDYSVTPMDDAMLTRLVHLTMVFDPKTWAQWAESAGVDSRTNLDNVIQNIIENECKYLCKTAGY